VIFTSFGACIATSSRTSRSARRGSRRCMRP
jgi:hypothetical protein